MRSPYNGDFGDSSDITRYCHSFLRPCSSWHKGGFCSHDGSHTRSTARSSPTAAPSFRVPQHSGRGILRA
eukprot:58819-Alexandrium_andersonii.AAC.1